MYLNIFLKYNLGNNRTFTEPSSPFPSSGVGANDARAGVGIEIDAGVCIPKIDPVVGVTSWSGDREESGKTVEVPTTKTIYLQWRCWNCSTDIFIFSGCVIKR